MAITCRRLVPRLQFLRHIALNPLALSLMLLGVQPTEVQAWTLKRAAIVHFQSVTACTPVKFQTPQMRMHMCKAVIGSSTTNSSMPRSISSMLQHNHPSCRMPRSYMPSRQCCRTAPASKPRHCLHICNSFSICEVLLPVRQTQPKQCVHSSQAFTTTSLRKQGRF